MPSTLSTSSTSATPNYDVKKDKDLRGLYTAKKKFEVVDVPAMTFLMADGEGSPNTSQLYRDIVQALYATAYAVRALAIDELGKKHTVGPLEGLWWADDLQAFTTSRDEDGWQWRLMIVQPDWITGELFAEGRKRAIDKKHLTAGDRVRLDEFHEGKSVQVLHTGPYNQEGPTIARMHDEFMPQQALKPRGNHHEIYLSDARRTDPSRLRTILRQPVEPAGG
ncbi:GyrI-like domain-containing protein [Streptomyces sp. NPDC058284]|uniref:GyrI-like domain-containing protein n=1 Tax=unclassified Streptomyces TaxID=2593676 RepID=UPI00365520FA